MTKTKLFILIILVVGIASLVVFKYESKSTPVAPETIWVKTVTVKETSLPVVAKVIGTTVAPTVVITPEVAGHIKTISFQDGTSVKKATALIQLDDAVYKAQYASVSAKLVLAENNYKRMALLGKKGIIAKQTIDQTEADLKQTRAAAQESLVMLQKLTLTAPFDGIIGKSLVHPGDYVTVGQNLVTLTDTKHLRVEYNLPDKYLSLLKTGQQVKVTTSAYPHKTFFGKLTFISPTINTENRSISVYADIENEQNALAAGMFVNVKQSLGVDEKVLIIPARSLVPVLDGEQVYRIVDGKAFATTILTGRRTKENVQVIDGLKKDDVIVTDGQIKIKNGVSVKINS